MTFAADRIEKRVAPLVENMAESASACLLTMVQGNLLDLTLGHWLIASRTGIVGGAVAAAFVFVSRITNRWVLAGTLGLTTAVADYFAHPAQFGAGATEAVVTGAGAGALSLGVTMIRRRSKESPDD